MWPDALAHAVPFQHTASADPAIVVTLTALGVAASILAGILLTRALTTADMRSFAGAAAFGALLFLFFDLVKETASLGQGLVQKPLYQAALLASFAFGLLLIPALSRGGDKSPHVFWLWALGIGAHGAGEAWIVGTEALTADITAPFQAASFLVHKVVEGFTIPLVAGIVATRQRSIGASALLALIALAAAAAGYVLGPGRAPLFLFAIGAGAASYALLRLATRFPHDTRHAAAAAIGLILVYVAGLLHEISA